MNGYLAWRAVSIRDVYGNCPLRFNASLSGRDKSSEHTPRENAAHIIIIIMIFIDGYPKIKIA